MLPWRTSLCSKVVTAKENWHYTLPGKPGWTFPNIKQQWLTLNAAGKRVTHSTAVKIQSNIQTYTRVQLVCSRVRLFCELRCPPRSCVPVVSTNISIYLHKSSPKIKLQRAPKAWDIQPNLFLWQENNAGNCVCWIQDTFYQRIQTRNIRFMDLLSSQLSSAVCHKPWLWEWCCIQQGGVYPLLGENGLGLSFFRCCRLWICSFPHTDRHAALPGNTQAAAPHLKLWSRECCSTLLLWCESLSIIPLHLHLLLISCFLKASSVVSYSYSMSSFSWPRNTQSMKPGTPSSCALADTSPKISHSPWCNFQHSPTGVILTTDFIIALDHLRVFRKLPSQTGCWADTRCLPLIKQRSPGPF